MYKTGILTRRGILDNAKILFLEKGYKKFEEYIVVQIEYSDEIGLVVPEGYDEY